MNGAASFLIDLNREYKIDDNQNSKERDENKQIIIDSSLHFEKAKCKKTQDKRKRKKNEEDMDYLFH